MGRHLPLCRVFLSIGLLSNSPASIGSAKAQLGPSRAVSPSDTLILKNGSQPDSKSPALRPSEVFDGLSSLNAIGQTAAKSHGLTSAATALGHAGGAAGALGAGMEGSEKGQDWKQSTMRGMASIAGAGAGEAVMVATFCIATEVIGCAIAGFAGALLGGKGTEGAYDYAVDWINSKKQPQDRNEAEGRRLSRADSSVLGDPCVDYNVKGDLGVCADGSFAPPPQLDIEPFGRGSPPAWINLR